MPMRFVAKLLVVLAILVAPGCYPHDCKPGDACWQSCAENPNLPGCYQPFGASKTDGGTDR